MPSLTIHKLSHLRVGHRAQRRPAARAPGRVPEPRIILDSTRYAERDTSTAVGRARSAAVWATSAPRITMPPTAECEPGSGPWSP